MPATLDRNARLLVTGASGHLGQLVVKQLLDTLHVSPSHVVATSRNPDSLGEFAARGVITQRLDFNDASSIEAAAQGVDRALVISSSDIANRVASHKAAVAALVAAGVKHILYTSFLNADQSIMTVSREHAATEQLIRESGVAGYTFLRNGMYFENDMSTIASAKRSGKWFSAAKDGKLAGISREDLALANATTLASDEYESRVYELSGKEGLTIDEMVANVSEALGLTTPTQVIQVSEQELSQGIAAATGYPPVITDMIASFDANTAAGLGVPSQKISKSSRVGTQ